MVGTPGIGNEKRELFGPAKIESIIKDPPEIPFPGDFLFPG
jgi:hypothetical protein